MKVGHQSVKEGDAGHWGSVERWDDGNLAAITKRIGKRDPKRKRPTIWSAHRGHRGRAQRQQQQRSFSVFLVTQKLVSMKSARVLSFDVVLASFFVVFLSSVVTTAHAQTPSYRSLGSFKVPYPGFLNFGHFPTGSLLRCLVSAVLSLSQPLIHPFFMQETTPSSSAASQEAPSHMIKSLLCLFLPSSSSSLRAAHTHSDTGKPCVSCLSCLDTPFSVLTWDKSSTFSRPSHPR